jgi:hypothetical protein
LLNSRGACSDFCHRWQYDLLKGNTLAIS